MQTNKLIRYVVCGVLLLGGPALFAQYFGSTSSWGNNGYVNDYYYGDRSAFQMDDNMFSYGNTATQNMSSTSSYFGASATFETAASTIIAGSTLADFESSRSARRGRGRDDHQWETDDVAPIGDGLWMLLLLAIGYGVRVYVRSLRCKKLDRCAVRS